MYNFFMYEILSSIASLKIFLDVTNNLLDRLLAYYPSRGLTSEPLYFMLLDAIMSLEMEAGVRVVGIIGKPKVSLIF